MLIVLRLGIVGSAGRVMAHLLSYEPILFGNEFVGLSKQRVKRLEVPVLLKAHARAFERCNEC